jgi:hypothetical protein
MWAQQRYLLYPARWHRHRDEPSAAIKFATVRGLRSATAFQSTLNWMQSQPNQATVGHKNQPTGVLSCNPTDEMAYTYSAYYSSVGPLRYVALQGTRFSLHSVPCL